MCSSSKFRPPMNAPRQEIPKANAERSRNAASQAAHQPERQGKFDVQRVQERTSVIKPTVARLFNVDDASQNNPAYQKYCRAKRIRNPYRRVSKSRFDPLDAWIAFPPGHLPFGVRTRLGRDLFLQLLECRRARL